MQLTNKEAIVLSAVKNAIDEHCPTIAYSEIENMTKLPSNILRGVVSSLVKKGMITSDYEKDANISFIGLRNS